MLNLEQISIIKDSIYNLNDIRFYWTNRYIRKYPLTYKLNNEDDIIEAEEYINELKNKGLRSMDFKK